MEGVADGPMPIKVGVSVKVGVGSVAVMVGVSLGVRYTVLVAKCEGVGVNKGDKMLVTSETEQASSINVKAESSAIFFMRHLVARMINHFSNLSISNKSDRSKRSDKSNRSVKSKSSEMSKRLKVVRFALIRQFLWYNFSP